MIAQEKKAQEQNVLFGDNSAPVEESQQKPILQLA